MAYAKYYLVEIGGSQQENRLTAFMQAIEELAAQYKDIEVNTYNEFYKERTEI